MRIEEGKHGGQAVYLECEVCGSEVKQFYSEYRERPRRFCSRECTVSASKVTLQCDNCGEKFQRTKSDIGPSKSGLRFCSRECKSQAQSLTGIPEVCPTHYGTSKARTQTTKKSEAKECTVPTRTHKTWYRSPYPVGTPEGERDRHLMGTFGITLDFYRRLFESQGGVCAICGSVCRAKPSLAVDHSHETGEVRGLLCMTCNTKLGWFENNEKSVLSYLKKYGK